MQKLRAAFTPQREERQGDVDGDEGKVGEEMLATHLATGGILVGTETELSSSGAVARTDTREPAVDLGLDIKCDLTTLRDGGRKSSARGNRKGSTE